MQSQQAHRALAAVLSVVATLVCAWQQATAEEDPCQVVRAALAKKGTNLEEFQTAIRGHRCQDKNLEIRVRIRANELRAIKEPAAETAARAIPRFSGGTSRTTGTTARQPAPGTTHQPPSKPKRPAPRRLKAGPSWVVHELIKEHHAVHQAARELLFAARQSCPPNQRATSDACAQEELHTYEQAATAYLNVLSKWSEATTDDYVAALAPMIDETNDPERVLRGMVGVAGLRQALADPKKAEALLKFVDASATLGKSVQKDRQQRLAQAIKNGLRDEDVEGLMDAWGAQLTFAMVLDLAELATISQRLAAGVTGKQTLALVVPSDLPAESCAGRFTTELTQQVAALAPNGVVHVKATGRTLKAFSAEVRTVIRDTDTTESTCPGCRGALGVWLEEDGDILTIRGAFHFPKVEGDGVVVSQESVSCDSATTLLAVDDHLTIRDRC
jgi:hypothetical protein